MGFVILNDPEIFEIPLNFFTVFYSVLRNIYCMNIPAIAIVMNWRKQKNTPGLYPIHIRNRKEAFLNLPPVFQCYALKIAAAYARHLATS